MSSNVAVASKELNFASKREQAISASSSRLEIPSVNGQSFQCTQTIDIKMPSGMVRGSYLDFENSYVKLGISAKRAAGDATGDLDIARNGIFNLISRVEILSSTSTISVIENYNQLVNIFLDSEASTAYKLSLGNAQFGMSGSVTLKGVSLVMATADELKKTVYCLPLILTPLWSSSKYLPCFHQDNLTIRLTLDNFDNAFISGTASAEVSSCFTVNPVSMVCNVVTLDPAARNMTDQSNGCVHATILDDFRSSRGGSIINQFWGLDCMTQVLNFLSSGKFCDYTLSAHNGGKYDVNLLLEYTLLEHDFWASTAKVALD
jgi:hypothetical protein